MTIAGSCPTLSIGVLAHNEEAHIEETLRSVFAQDVFQRFATEIVIVANGCTDGTVAKAGKVLADHRITWAARGSARVEDVAAAGKTNAWNLFVHRFSSPAASALVLADADITILNPNTISSMVATLQSNPHAVICVDRNVKDIEVKTNRTLFERLLVAATPAIDPENIALCGQLYCAYSGELRQIVLPTEITCDDGFLRALLLTQGFTMPEDPRRIVMDDTVTHSFAAVANLRELFKHEKWVVAGNIVNALLFERFWAEAGAHCSAMTLMQQWQAQDSQWLPRYIQSQVKARGWQLLPRGCWTRRWARLKGRPIWKLVFGLPLATIAAGVDAAVFLAAIIDVRRGRAFRYWGRGKEIEA
jgi:glycosyltransferase involved in cell wall biosynthesis